MRKIPSVLALLVLGGLAAGQSHAQTRAQAAQPKAAQTQVAAIPEPNVLRDTALRIAMGLEDGHAQQIWGGASAAVKNAQAGQDFVKRVAEQRLPSQRAVGRQWQSMEIVDIPPGSTTVPAGRYANVRFATLLPDRTSHRELVTLRMDEDSNWRFAGYAIE